MTRKVMADGNGSSSLEKKLGNLFCVMVAHLFLPHQKQGSYMLFEMLTSASCESSQLPKLCVRTKTNLGSLPSYTVGTKRLQRK